MVFADFFRRAASPAGEGLGVHIRARSFFCNRVGFPRGGSCQRPRPLTDEGRTCRYAPYTGCRGKLSPHPALRGHLPPRGKAWGLLHPRQIKQNFCNHHPAVPGAAQHGGQSLRYAFAFGYPQLRVGLTGGGDLPPLPRRVGVVGGAADSFPRGGHSCRASRPADSAAPSGRSGGRLSRISAP